jgi:hypothetical protein
MIIRSRTKRNRLYVASALLLVGLLVPVFALNLQDFVVFSSNNTSIKDRSIAKGGLVGSNIYIELGCDAQSIGALSSPGNAIMRDRAKVTGDVTLGGVLSRQNNTVVTGTITQHGSVAAFNIPTLSFYVGVLDINVGNGQTYVLSPGIYRDFHAFSNATIKLTSGQYYFRKFQCEPDVKLQYAISGGVSAVAANEAVALADRVKISFTGTTSPGEYILFFSNQSPSIRIGCDAIINGSFSAPNAEIILSSRVKMKGSAFAKMVTLEPDVTIEK